ncbi:MAG: divalent-cation tolerance protein CutA [Pseudomonadota bacterium]
MADISLIRVNCPSEEVAETLASKAVELRLAACANLEGPVRSIYRWEGRLERDTEWVLWLKAPADNWSRIEALILEHHPHTVPAILAIPCSSVHAPYANWLAAETGE